MPSLKAGRLRHRVTIQEYVYQGQDPDTGAEIRAWSDVAGCESVPCAIEPLSAREFIAAQSTQSQVVARIVMRYREGLDASMRIVHKGKIYNPQGFLADADSGLEYFTIPVTQGVNDG